MADRGYDDSKLHRLLWDGHRIKSVIDIRNLWKDGEKTRLLTGQENVVYDDRGEVYCHCPQTNQVRAMAYGGLLSMRTAAYYGSNGVDEGPNSRRGKG